MSLNLAFNFSFPDLYDTEKLQELHAHFLSFLKTHDYNLFERYTNKNNIDESELLLELAPIFEAFIAILFNIKNRVTLLQKTQKDFDPIITMKRQFIQRHVLKRYNLDDVQNFDIHHIEKQLTALIGSSFDEDILVKNISKWQENSNNYENELEIVAQYCAWMCLHESARNIRKKSILFKNPQKINPQNLIDLETTFEKNISLLKSKECDSTRHDFSSSDPGYNQEQALLEAHYCIWCHKQKKDSCSKGLIEKNTATFQKNSFEITLTGCPLEQKISEMNLAKSQGFSIGSLAIAMIDNPMIAATGHRICNDCMKACIYQKQDPVNIPALESQTLQDVLNLPFGFEIYSLLSRWNPLNFKKPFPSHNTAKNILVVGSGPAGFTLSHHLLNDGHNVVMIEGLKVESLPNNGVDHYGKRTSFSPIENIDNFFENLNERTIGGFGGVAEYGITVRWNKNNLKMIRMLLERRANFRLYDSVRFGSSMDFQDAFDLGFDHVALCTGAGSPNIIPLKNNLAAGVRTASDFLMALQLTGAFRQDLLSNLTVRLPIVVIGGGLTAVDTATESLTYYITQTKKIKKRILEITNNIGKQNFYAQLSVYEKDMLQEFLTDADFFESHTPKEIRKFLQQKGGATILYRRSLEESPAYKLNHEELEKAFDEGIFFASNVTPLKINTDDSGHATSIFVQQNNNEITYPAKTILIAAGTKPNIQLHDEIKGVLSLNKNHFQATNDLGEKITPQVSPKPDEVFIFADSIYPKRISFFGDLHPSFSGNVVKAMASAKQGAPIISRALENQSSSNISFDDLCKKLNHNFITTVEKIERLTPNIVEVILKAPAACKKFKPGQFFRLQNYESFAQKTSDTTFLMEGLALTGAQTDLKKETLSTIVLEMGGSSNLCSLLKEGERVSLMGPTGEATNIPENKTVLLCGGGLGNAVLFSIGKALLEKNNRVLYFAAYKKAQDVFKQDDIEAACTHVVWCCEEKELTPRRPQDFSFQGNIIDALMWYSAQDTSLKLASTQHMIVIGSDAMMKAVAYAKNHQLKNTLVSCTQAIGSINSPMQCMMKEICAQCLQKHIDPITGQESIIYSCKNQDQNLDSVDFDCLHARLSQNSLQEKITKQWIKIKSDQLK